MRLPRVQAMPVMFAAVLLAAAGATVCAAQTASGGAGAESAPAAGHGADAKGRDGTRLFLEVPLTAPSPGVVFPFGGSHHQVPGVVAVNRAPYYCVPHTRAFRTRADFVAHLRRRHGLRDADIPAAVLVEGGQVRYVGD